MLLLLDNYDSFTFNLAHYFEALGQQVMVVRNDAISVAEIAQLNPDYLVISPGPCTPTQAGVSKAVIQAFAEQLPILGVCLGHQAMGEVFGATTGAAARIQHGKVTSIEHVQAGLFADIPSPCHVTRYHSLALDRVPNDFELLAWSMDAEGKPQDIMAMAHRELPLFGVQYHPESVMTEGGYQLLGNFLSCGMKG